MSNLFFNFISFKKKKKLQLKLAQKTICSFATSSACYFLIKENMTSMQKCQLGSLVTYHKIIIYRAKQKRRARANPPNENNCVPFSQYFSVRIKNDAPHRNSFLLVIVSMRGFDSLKVSTIACDISGTESCNY